MLRLVNFQLFLNAKFVYVYKFDVKQKAPTEQALDRGCVSFDILNPIRIYLFHIRLKRFNISTANTLVTIIFIIAPIRELISICSSS